MIERCQDLRLALEAGETLGIGGQRRGEKLDRHVAAERRVGGLPHFAHAPDADLRAEAVVQDRAA